MSAVIALGWLAYSCAAIVFLRRMTTQYNVKGDE